VARLVIPRTVARDTIGFLASLPLSVWYDPCNFDISEEQEADVTPAFEHPDPICEIHLRPTMSYSSSISIRNKSFVELEHVVLSGFAFSFSLLGVRSG